MIRRTGWQWFDRFNLLQCSPPAEFHTPVSASLERAKRETRDGGRGEWNEFPSRGTPKNRTPVLRPGRSENRRYETGGVSTRRRRPRGVGNGISHSVSVVITSGYSTARSSHRSTEPCTLIAPPASGYAVSSMHGLSSKLRVPKLAGSTRYLRAFLNMAF
jgi:hypothetical protein